jgi:chromosome segregation ATPase
MWSLESELIIVLLVASFIGLLMGRFLCKNGESEERIEKEKVLYALTDAKNNFLNQEIMLKKLQEHLKEKEEHIAELEQHNNNILTQFNTSDNQRILLLKELQVFEKYKSRFEALTTEFEVQTELIKNLNQEKRVCLEKMDSSQALIERLSEKNIKILEKSSELSQIIEKANLEIERLKKLVVSLEVHKEKFNDEKIKKFIEIEKYLRAELENIEIERDDLVSRLRAISSVVGAVGVEEE